jgi:hypothetical protein
LKHFRWVNTDGESPTRKYEVTEAFFATAVFSAPDNLCAKGLEWRELRSSRLPPGKAGAGHSVFIHQIAV